MANKKRLITILSEYSAKKKLDEEFSIIDITELFKVVAAEKENIHENDTDIRFIFNQWINSYLISLYKQPEKILLHAKNFQLIQLLKLSDNTREKLFDSLLEFIKQDKRQDLINNFIYISNYLDFVEGLSYLKEYHTSELLQFLSDEENKNKGFTTKNLFFKRLVVDCLNEGVLDINYTDSNKSHVLTLFNTEDSQIHTIKKLKERGLNCYLYYCDSQYNILFLELLKAANIQMILTLFEVNDYEQIALRAFKNHLYSAYNQSEFFNSPLAAFHKENYPKLYADLMSSIEEKIVYMEKKSIIELVGPVNEKRTSKRI